MSETTSETAENSETDQSTAAETDDEASSNVAGYLYRGALVLLVLLAVVATLQLYFAVGRAINIWISSDFAPIFQAGLHLVVLLAAAIGISAVLRRMGG